MSNSNQCLVWEKSYFNRANLKTHVQTHFEIKEYQCTYCEKYFNQSDYLNTHIETLHSGEIFECKNCHKHLNSRAYMLSHQKVCNKRLKCNYCGLDYGHNSTLYAHIRNRHKMVHEKEKKKIQKGKKWTFFIIFYAKSVSFNVKRK